MTTGKIDLLYLREEIPDRILRELIVGAGYIGACLRTLPDSERIKIEQQLVNGLSYAEELLPDGAKTIIEATVNASHEPDFIPWLLDYIESTHKHSP